MSRSDLSELVPLPSRGPRAASRVRVAVPKVGVDDPELLPRNGHGPGAKAPWRQRDASVCTMLEPQAQIAQGLAMRLCKTDAANRPLNSVDHCTAAAEIHGVATLASPRAEEDTARMRCVPSGYPCVGTEPMAGWPQPKRSRELRGRRNPLRLRNSVHPNRYRNAANFAPVGGDGSRNIPQVDRVT